MQNQRERRYLALLDNSNEIVYTHDLKGSFTSINCTEEQVMGFSQSEILEMNIWQLVDPGYLIPLERMIARTVDAQTQMSDEVELVTKYGHSLMLEIHTHPINRDGKTIEIQGIASTPAELLNGASWESRILTGHNQAHTALAENEGLFLHAYEAANSFALQDDPANPDRTLFYL